MSVDSTPVLEACSMESQPWRRICMARNVTSSLWDILGKVVNRPIYKILGGTRNKIMGYASSQHLATVEDYIPDVQKALAAGFKAYKIHPGGGQHKNGGRIPSYLGHIDEIKLVRETAGDDVTLLYDAVQGNNYYEALAIGRALDKYGYVAYECPMYPQH